MKRMKRIFLLILSALILWSLCDRELSVDIPDNKLDTVTVRQQPPTLAEDESAVTFIDVGQGDCTLIRLFDGRTILIDAGESGSDEIINEYIYDCGIDTLDYVIATHPHADHIGGMEGVIREFDVKKIYMPKATATTKTYERFLRAVKEKGLKITTAKAGVKMIDEDGISAEFLAPVKSQYDDLNNYSAVLKLTCGKVSFLFTGDAEAEAERQIDADVGADILKVAHHGSSTSSSAEFISRVWPEVAVISCGEDNSYGHPHNKVMERLELAGARCYRTDVNGNITVVTNGEKYKIMLEMLEKDR